MTVDKMIRLLSELPGDSEVTDVCGNPVSAIRFKVNKEDREKLDVWFSTDYIYDKPIRK